MSNRFRQPRFKQKKKPPQILGQGPQWFEYKITLTGVMPALSPQEVLSFVHQQLSYSVALGQTITGLEYEIDHYTPPKEPPHGDGDKEDREGADGVQRPPAGDTKGDGDSESPPATGGIVLSE